MISFGDFTKVNIDLDKSTPGLYLFMGDGAIGKSYLSRIFVTEAEEENLYVKTYFKGKILEWGNKDSARIMLYDRLDLYFDESIKDEINKYSKIKPIMADLKNMSLINNGVINSKVGFIDIFIDMLVTGNELNVEVLQR